MRTAPFSSGYAVQGASAVLLWRTLTLPRTGSPGGSMSQWKSAAVTSVCQSAASGQTSI